MIIGVPKEIKAQENRVAITPNGVTDLVRHGKTVFIQRGAGLESGFSDEEYLIAGAQILPDAAAIFDQAQLIVKVKEPQASEIAMLRPHHTLFTYLHLAASLELTQGLLQSGATAFAYETLSIKGALPLLEPMSEVAGRMSAIEGSNYLAKHRQGSGVLISGVPGLAPGKVLVIGGGTSGLAAARVAAGMGAEVTLLELNPDRIRYIEQNIPQVRALHSDAATLDAQVAQSDLVIGAVLIPGAAAPKLITRNHLRSMRPGSVFVDIAIDQGGCAETSRATTHQDPVFVEEGVVHYCVANMPGAYPRTASQALNIATQSWIRLIADHDFDAACKKRPELLSALNIKNGKLTYKAVADTFKIPFTPADHFLNS